MVWILTLQLYFVASISEWALVSLVWLRRRRDEIVLQGVLLVQYGLLIYESAVILLIGEQPILSFLRT